MSGYWISESSRRDWIASIFIPRSVQSCIFMRRKKKENVYYYREEKKQSRMCAFGSHYGRLRTIMENADNARADRARHFHVIPFSVGSLFRVRMYIYIYIYIYIYKRRVYCVPCTLHMHTRVQCALTYHGCTQRAFRVSRTRASVTPMHPSFVIYRTRYRSLIAYCNTRSYP